MPFICASSDAIYRNRLFWLVILLAVSLGLCAAAEPERQIPFEGQVDAPEFPAGIAWLNTDQPLALKDLRGKIVLLDFWTYCCINCMHIIPDLKKLEAKYPKELVVIGVHSAKFQNEKETDNIREAIKRYEIEHPVINDRDFLVWRSYHVRAWPSLMLINPRGRVIGSHSGEGIFDLFDDVIGKAVKYFDAKGLINREPIKFRLEKDSELPSLLSYPGKIAADEKENRLVFSDSNHNRIIVSDLTGQILEIIGDGETGLKDGSFSEARFFRPQGVCLDAPGNCIYVADTENHAIRKIDLKTRKVTTLAGNGRQGTRRDESGAMLNSPWDLVLIKDLLYVAMAGPHQVWTVDPKTGAARVYAGSGRENITDGPLAAANLAQPSGITTDGQRLYFADSEVSAVRSADLDSKGEVKTLIGKGLFDFGDVDGKYPEARLQHPLGVLWHDGAIYVADTYNHKIRKLNPETRELATFLGTGKRGYKDGPGSSAQFNEPSGLAAAAGKLFIADANNHLIRVCNLSNGSVSTMEWKGLEKMAAPSPAVIASTPAQVISPNTREFEFRLNLPEGKKVNLAARSSLQAQGEGAIEVAVKEFPITEPTIRIPIKLNPGAGKLKLSLTLFYCDKGNAGLCYFKQQQIEIPLTIKEGAEERPSFSYTPEQQRAER